MAMLRREDQIYVLDLGDGENRFSAAAVDEIAQALAEVAGAEGPRALVTTATGKFFSNGLDLDWLLASPEESHGYVGRVQELFATVLTLPLPTVAAVSGHAFAAGGMLALCHDTRVMRADRGFFCLPEVDLGLPFTWGMSELIRSRLAPQVAHEAMTTGRRYGGEQCLVAGIVEHAVDTGEVLPLALRLAGDLAGTAGETLGTIKQRLYAPVVAQLRTKGPG
jgi:enoyl-CoA hydratase/carnithine racemase